MLASSPGGADPEVKWCCLCSHYLRSVEVWGWARRSRRVGREEKDPEQKSTSLFAGESKIER